jgi:Carboxypeptidase regulatory-like domain
VRIQAFSIILGLVFMDVCACTGQTPAGGESGIEGIITISPARPGPIRADEAGSVPLANATFAVENNSGEVASFTTDDQGRFRASLPPGHYKVSLKGRKTSIGRFGPFEVDVTSGKMTNVQWKCDSGIR